MYLTHIHYALVNQILCSRWLVYQTRKVSRSLFSVSQFLAQMLFGQTAKPHNDCICNIIVSHARETTYYAIHIAFTQDSHYVYSSPIAHDIYYEHNCSVCGLSYLARPLCPLPYLDALPRPMGWPFKVRVSRTMIPDEKKNLTASSHKHRAISVAFKLNNVKPDDILVSSRSCQPLRPSRIKIYIHAYVLVLKSFHTKLRIYAFYIKA